MTAISSFQRDFTIYFPVGQREGWRGFCQLSQQKILNKDFWNLKISKQNTLKISSLYKVKGNQESNDYIKDIFIKSLLVQVILSNEKIQNLPLLIRISNINRSSSILILGIFLLKIQAKQFTDIKMAIPSCKM